MKKTKMTDALQYLDDELIISAMDPPETQSMRKEKNLISERRKSMTQRITHNSAWIQFAAIAAMFAIVFATIFALNIFGTGNTVVAMDVNPSIELELDRNEKVVEVRVLNDDAETVIGQLELKGKTLTEALDIIVGALMEHGFITVDQNSILISVDADNKAGADAVKKTIYEELGKLFESKGIDLSVLMQSFEKNEEDDKRAEENKISRAKASLIQKIIDAGLLDANGVPYTYEVLAALRVHELKLILDSKKQEIGGVDNNGDACTGKNYISRREALDIALAKAGLAEEDVKRIELEMDFDDDFGVGVMVYEVEFISGDIEYEYEIRATDGEILEEDTEPVKVGNGGGNGAWDDDDEDDDDNIALPENAISREKALEIALMDAGLSADSVRRAEIELDREDGSTVYEVEFKKDHTKYEYVIDASSGVILEKDSEPCGK